MDDCQLCAAEQVTPWLHEDDDCWVAECLVCRTPMIVWRSHGLPEPELETALLTRLERIAPIGTGRRATGSTPSGGGSPTTGTPTHVPRAGSSTPRATSSVASTTTLPPPTALPELTRPRASPQAAGAPTDGYGGHAGGSGAERCRRSSRRQVGPFLAASAVLLLLPWMHLAARRHGGSGAPREDQGLQDRPVASDPRRGPGHSERLEQRPVHPRVRRRPERPVARRASPRRRTVSAWTRTRWSPIDELTEVDAKTRGPSPLTLSPGRYVLFCNLEGHYLAGMHAAIEVSAGA